MNDELRNKLIAEWERGGRAYIRNIIAAEEAILRGKFNMAKILRASAHAQRVMAMEAMRLLDNDMPDEELLNMILDEIRQDNDIKGSEQEDSDLQGRLERSAKVREGLRDILGRSIDSLQHNSDVLESDVAQFLWGCYNCGVILEGDPPHACPNCGAMSVEFQWFGPFYSSTPEHLGQLTPDDIITILEGIPDQIEATISQVDDAVLRRKPSPDEWCAAEIVGHILETDKLFVTRVEALLESQGVEMPRPMPPWKLHEGKGYESMSVSELMRHMREARDHSLELVRSLKPEDWSLTGQNVGATTSILDLGTWLTNHDRGHLAQIQQLCEV